MLMTMGLMLGGMEYMDEETTPNKDVLNRKPKKKVIPKGLKPFHYGNKIIYAISKKVADKKALKKGYLNKSK